MLSIEVTNGGTKQGVSTTYGSTMTLWCDDGYWLDHQDIRQSSLQLVCQASGAWSDQQQLMELTTANTTVSCQGKFNPFLLILN